MLHSERCGEDLVIGDVFLTEQTNLILCAVPELEADARTLAVKLGVPMADAPAAGQLCLQLKTDGLYLERDGLSLRGDFAAMLPRLRPNALNGEMLVKAARLKGFEGTPTAVDATAGLGEDALLLAAAGFSVTLFERNPVIAALLRDALVRAAEVPELREIVGRMTLREGDSIRGLRELETPPEVILLDPMFPARRKSGLIGKKLQLLQRLEAPCADEAELLDAAIAAGPRKVVVKRPLKGPNLADRKPAYSIRGKAVRYDCIVPPHGSESKK